MDALNEKYEKPTKKDFDTEIALIIQKGTDYVKYRVSADGKARFPGMIIPYNHQFWVVPMRDTMFENVEVETVYRFILKLLEARDAWIEATDAEQVMRQTPHNCQTAQAIDGFNNIVAAAGCFQGAIASDLALFMTASMAGQVEREHASDLEDSSDEEDSLENIENNVEEDRPEQIDGAQDDQDESIADAATEQYDTYLQQMHMEDMNTAEDEDMMDVD